MTGKFYYLTTLGDWKRHAATFANSHWLVLKVPDDAIEDYSTTNTPAMVGDSASILVVIEADEGTHGMLEDDPSFEPLPHPLSQKAISETVQLALSSHGVKCGASTLDATEMMARVHPLLRHRVF